MAEILLNKIVNGEINVNLFVKWLLHTNSQDQYFSGFEAIKCSQTDFLTYFLNFLHEEIPCFSKYGETSQKPSQKPNSYNKHMENDEKKIPSLIFKEDKLNKSASYPHALHKTLDDSPTTNPNVWRNSSTPKLIKISSDCILNSAQVSPISPLYRNQYSFSPANNSYTSKGTEKGTPLCLGDFIIHKKSSTKKKANKNILSSETHDESSRRIKPTCLSQVKSSYGFRKSDNSFNNFQSTKEVSVELLNDSRNFLAEERLKILSRKDSGASLTVKPSKTIASLMNFKVEIEPDVNCITDKEKLNYIVEIYVNVLKNSLVLNITSEIYFLISLLFSKQFIDNKGNTSANSNEEIPLGVDFLNEEGRRELQSVFKSTKTQLCCSELFETVHNVVYFATKCLEMQIDVLKCYDKSTLKLLSQNKRFRLFSVSFAEKLGKISEKKAERVVELPENSSQTNVCFNLDTDNRENFPTDTTFHTFRKQRDLFYEILRVWEKQRLVADWRFSVSLGGKVKSLFGLQSETVTFVHFCRLFKAQLLSSCGKFQKEEGLSDTPFLTSIPNVDADKLNRLNSRLTTKQSSNGINAAPVFTGYQEFYKDFIIIAGNHAFNKHLCDTLIAEIVELNDAKFSCTNLEEIDVCVDPGTRKSYVACLKSLRTLAKFLGFVEALPYKSDCPSFSEKVLNFQIDVRKEVLPAFDVRKLLENAVEQRSIVLTVPWLTEYLSMLDYVTLRLPYYISLYKMLFDLYKNYETVLSNNVSLVKFCLGWLFELSHFPDSEYFNFCTSATESSVSNKKTHRKDGKEQKLDSLDIVDQNTLYDCCSYLEEIKKLLSSNASNASVTVKHITPLSAVQSSNEIAKKRLEQQLEEAFFNGQPLSVRKTVEFVSERVASACVKQICNSIVPPFKKTALASLREFLNNVHSPTKDKSLKATLRSKVNQMAQDNLKSLRENCEKEAKAIIDKRVPTSVSALLSVDVLPQTRDVCVGITTRMCVERVQQWLNSHVTITVFTKDFNSETQKILCAESRKIVKEKPLFLLPSGGSFGNHNENSTSGFHMLERIKGLSMNILENSISVNEKMVATVLDDAYATLTERSDVNECIVASICTLLVDVSLLLITHKPSLMLDEGLLKNFVRLWRCHRGKMEDLFKSIFCPRNVMLFAQSCNEVTVWETLATFVVFLLEESVLTCEEFEVQCTGFYKKDWDQGTLSNYVAFLRHFLKCYKNKSDDVSKFTLLLEFLSDFSTDL